MVAMERPPVEPAVFDVNEALVYLNTNRTKLFELKQQGKIKSFKIGKRRLFSRQACDALIEQLEREAGQSDTTA